MDNENGIVSLKYSILIPSRNGVKYLPFAIQTVLGQKETNFELIVSDNYSSDGTWEYLTSLTDNRLKIVRPLEPVSMVRHFEFILKQAKGEWISLFGDDDGLQPYFFDLVNKLTRQYSNSELIHSNRAYYFWPGCARIYGNQVLSYEASKHIELRNSRIRFWKLLFGDSTYLAEPQFYTGTLFRRSLLERITKLQGGMIFNSITPDANSVALVLKHVKNYAYSEVPFGWIGSSPKSTGFSTANDEKSKRTSDFVNLNTNDSIQINKGYKNVVALFDIHCFFLEALAQSNLLYSTFISKLITILPFRYLIFLKVYRNYRDRKISRPESVPYYEELFKEQGLSISVLKVVHKVSLFSDRVLRIKQRLFKRGINDPGSVVLNSESHVEYPTIIEANILTNKLYSDSLKQ